MAQTTNGLKDTIDELWERIPREHGHPPVEHFDLDEAVVEHQSEETERARVHLEPWVTLSAQGLLWLTHLHICLDDVAGNSSRHRTTWALTGFATAHGVAIRNLVLTGIDTAARALLRTYIEALTFCVICLHDEELAGRFVAAQDPVDAKRLWRAELSGQALRTRFLQAIGPRDRMVDEALTVFTEWLTSDKEDYSQSVHASYLACVMASVPPDIETGEMRPGIIGRATGASVRTLESLSKVTWFFSRMMTPLFLGTRASTSRRLRAFTSDAHFDSIVITGYYVLNELLTLYWDAPSTAVVEPRWNDGTTRSY